MGLDVYVGSLTRYYARQWQTVTERHARERGIAYHRISTGDEEGGLKDPVAIRRVVVDRWLPAVAAGLKGRISVPFEWDESDDAPYFTDKPDWSGYHALVLAAAYHDHQDLPVPQEVPGEIDDDAAWRRTTVDGFVTRFDALFAPTYWLPMDFDLTFAGPTPSGYHRTIGSSYALLRALGVLNGERFRASASDLRSWRDGDGLSGLSDFEAAARNTFAMLCELTGKSVEHRLPIVLDY
jgi:hypothetical protein